MRTPHPWFHGGLGLWWLFPMHVEADPFRMFGDGAGGHTHRGGRYGHPRCGHV